MERPFDKEFEDLLRLIRRNDQLERETRIAWTEVPDASREEAIGIVDEFITGPKRNRIGTVRDRLRLMNHLRPHAPLMINLDAKAVGAYAQVCGGLTESQRTHITAIHRAAATAAGRPPPTKENVDSLFSEAGDPKPAQRRAFNHRVHRADLPHLLVAPPAIWGPTYFTVLMIFIVKLLWNCGGRWTGLPGVRLKHIKFGPGGIKNGSPLYAEVTDPAKPNKLRIIWIFLGMERDLIRLLEAHPRKPADMGWRTFVAEYPDEWLMPDPKDPKGRMMLQESTKDGALDRIGRRGLGLTWKLGPYAFRRNLISSSPKNRASLRRSIGHTATGDRTHDYVKRDLSENHAVRRQLGFNQGARTTGIPDQPGLAAATAKIHFHADEVDAE